ncbi:Clavaminate synthase-like protein [Ramaria rubella]|nr:Clavaminate synthase-like protein [Ramaria rubella]
MATLHKRQEVKHNAEGAVLISYNTLLSNPNSLQPAISAALGSDPKCLGIIIVTDLPAEFIGLRERLLWLACKFAALPESVREKYADAKSRWSFGWSHGKEIMNGKPDLLKGSYYANPLSNDWTVSTNQKLEFPEYYGDNVWPNGTEEGVEGFEEAFKSLGQFVFKVGRELAAACQPFAASHLDDQSLTLPILISPNTTKARLLHYFPPSPLEPIPSENEPVDSWCGFHLDHSLLTGLCSALYLSHETPGEPTVCSPPSATSGLYIKTRGGELTKVSIPPNCLAFQTGEALEIATNGRLRATPHCVRVGSDSGAGKISRETFALFMQPDTEVNIGPHETFGSFSKRVFKEHYGIGSGTM